MSPRFSIITILVLCLALIPASAFCSTQIAEYLCEVGIKYYQAGRYDDALSEFGKALIVEPDNQTAKSYIDSIFTQKSLAEKKSQKAIQKGKPAVKQLVKSDSLLKRKKIIDKTLTNLIKKKVPRESEKITAKKPLKVDGITIKGETQISLGVTPDDVIWKRANADLNEKNYRLLSNTAFDRKINTSDPRIYDRFRLNLDSDNEDSLNFHSNITVDPWSFTGKSAKITLPGAAADPAEIELKYWSNTGYTIGETVFTLQNGDSFNLPEIKVVDSHISTPVRITSSFGNIYTLPELEINRQFQPVRELWFDYKNESAKVRFFPIAYQDQALTFDDPLVLSNNHIWWQQSPWIDRWLPGRLNPGSLNSDFTKGKFDDSLSYFTRDSDGTKLTALRGVSFDLSPQEDLSILSTFATPKDLWQDYDSFDNVTNATRLKYRLLDNFSLGSLFTYRVGLDENNRRDTANYVWGSDLGYEVWEGTKLTLEAAASKSQTDLSSETFRSASNGGAYHFSLFGTFPRKGIMDLAYGYNEIKPEKTDQFFTKYKIYAAHMDKGFNPVLSNYRQTRNDTFWSRHIHFRQPFKYFTSGLYESALSWDDIAAYRIGNGIDIGRDVLGFRFETSLFDEKLENLFDVRNVHKTDGKFIENVTRDEITYKTTDKLTTKLLGIYQKMPKTIAGIDPFIFDTDTAIFLNNADIPGDKDPTLKTGSAGAEYAFTDWIALSGIWERTNDYTLAYDNFPRGVLNNSSFTTFEEEGRIFRRTDPFLYSQALFPLPPYPFYNIFKTGLRLNPTDKLEIFLDYTRNEFKSAGQIDDNINHTGLEVSYLPTKKLGCFFRYTYSRWNDINRMLAREEKIYLGHHNFSMDFRYLPSDDSEVVFQYGESGISPSSIISYDPFGGSLSTLDTRHIVRMYYRRKF